jgi:neutral ceramidase
MTRAIARHRFASAIVLALTGLFTTGCSNSRLKPGDAVAGRNATTAEERAQGGTSAVAPGVHPVGPGSGVEVGEPLRVGRAAVKITPPVGSIMGNSYGTTVSKGVHDDLYVKAVVFEQSGVRAALVAADLISLHRPVVEEARRLIEQTTGIPGENVIISATHLHAGPQMHPLFWQAVGGLPQRKSEEYVRRLPAMTAESVRLAKADLQPARISAGTLQENAISFNRRYLMEDGTVEMNPGSLSPEIVRPAGPIDPEVSVVYFESLKEAKPLVTLVNFALHVAVLGGDHFSADFPGVLARLLDTVKGKEMLTIFTNGTSGNVNHLDVTRRRDLNGHAEAAKIGIILAADVLKTFPSLQPIENSPLRVRTQRVKLPAPKVKPEEVEWARQVMARNGKSDAPPFTEVVKAWRILDLAELPLSVSWRMLPPAF